MKLCQQEVNNRQNKIGKSHARAVFLERERDSGREREREREG